MRKALVVWCLMFTVMFAPVGAQTPYLIMFGQSTYLIGSATQEATRPYPDFTVRIRNVYTNDVLSRPLSTGGTFQWNNIPPAQYVVELLNVKQEVICTEGPVNVRAGGGQTVVIDCGKVPAAWWLLGAAAAAGVTAGIVALRDASPSR